VAKVRALDKKGAEILPSREKGENGIWLRGSRIRRKSSSRGNTVKKKSGKQGKKAKKRRAEKT